MMNPFITLSLLRTSEKIRININHIVSYERFLSKSTRTPFTLIILHIESHKSNREVVELPEEIDQLIRDKKITDNPSHVDSQISQALQQHK